MCVSVSVVVGGAGRAGRAALCTLARACTKTGARRNLQPVTLLKTAAAC